MLRRRCRRQPLVIVDSCGPLCDSLSVYQLQVSPDPSFPSEGLLLCNTNHTTFAPYTWEMKTAEPGL